MLVVLPVTIDPCCRKILSWLQMHETHCAYFKSCHFKCRFNTWKWQKEWKRTALFYQKCRSINNNSTPSSCLGHAQTFLYTVQTFVCFKADAQIIDIKWKKEKHLLCRCSIYVNIVHINNSCVSYSSRVFEGV